MPFFQQAITISLTSQGHVLMKKIKVCLEKNNGCFRRNRGKRKDGDTEIQDLKQEEKGWSGALWGYLQAQAAMSDAVPVSAQQDPYPGVSCAFTDTPLY